MTLTPLITKVVNSNQKCAAFSKYLHGFAHDLVALLSLQILIFFSNNFTILLSNGALKHLELLRLLGLQLIRLVAGDGALDIVELSQSLESDDALLIIIGLGSLGSSNAATLVLGEDVGGARDLRSRTTLAF